MLQTVRHEGADILPEVITEGVLPLDLQGLAVEVVILVEVFAGTLDEGPVLLVGDRLGGAP